MERRPVLACDATCEPCPRLHNLRRPIWTWDRAAWEARQPARRSAKPGPTRRRTRSFAARHQRPTGPRSTAAALGKGRGGALRRAAALSPTEASATGSGWTPTRVLSRHIRCLSQRALAWNDGSPSPALAGPATPRVCAEPGGASCLRPLPCPARRVRPAFVAGPAFETGRCGAVSHRVSGPRGPGALFPLFRPCAGKAGRASYPRGAG